MLWCAGGGPGALHARGGPCLLPSSSSLCALPATLRAPAPPRPALQPCVFRVEYSLEQAGGREFGSVFVNEKENAAAALVGAGLAKVRAAAAHEGDARQSCEVALRRRARGLPGGRRSLASQPASCPRGSRSRGRMLLALTLSAHQKGEESSPACTACASAGAQVRPPGGQQSPYYEELAKAAEGAEARGVGMYTKVGRGPGGGLHLHAGGAGGGMGGKDVLVHAG